MDIVINQVSNNQPDNINQNDYKCLCEKKLFNNTDTHCPRSLKEWCDFKMYCNNQVSECYTILCFPISFTLKFILTLPCATYNECRNCCNKTKNKNYIC